MNVEELQRQVEYKFAPGPLLAVQALANTFSFEDGEELLANPGSSADWLIRSGLVAVGTEVDDDEHERLRRFRKVVRSLIEANGGEPATPDLAGFRAFLTELKVPFAAATDELLEVDPGPADDVDGVIARMLGAIYRAQLLGEWARLKICASDECRWAFYDSSRNRGGTWCQMEVCGNRIKNRRYRGRRSGSSAATSASAVSQAER